MDATGTRADAPARAQRGAIRHATYREARRALARRWGALALGWAAAIYASSCTSVNREALMRGSERAVGGAAGQGLARFWGRYSIVLAKVWHGIEYGALFALAHRALRARAGGTVRNSVAPAALAAATFAVSDEWHQTRVEGRTGTARDVLIDIGGVCLAAAALLLAARYRSTDHRPQETSGRQANRRAA